MYYAKTYLFLWCESGKLIRLGLDCLGYFFLALYSVFQNDNYLLERSHQKVILANQEQTWEKYGQNKNKKMIFLCTTFFKQEGDKKDVSHLTL